jgi:hypothetical protein
MYVWGMYGEREGVRGWRADGQTGRGQTEGGGERGRGERGVRERDENDRKKEREREQTGSKGSRRLEGRPAGGLTEGERERERQARGEGRACGKATAGGFGSLIASHGSRRISPAPPFPGGWELPSKQASAGPPGDGLEVLQCAAVQRNCPAETAA